MKHHSVSMRSASATLLAVAADSVVVLHNKQLIGQRRHQKVRKPWHTYTAIRTAIQVSRSSDHS